MRRTLLTTVLATFLSFFVAPPLAAGEGTISGGKLNVLVYFEYDEMDPSSWEPVFDKFSALLLNATQGGLQLGTVTYTKCADLKEQADIWVKMGSGGASAHRNGLGVKGRHIFISNTHKSTSGSALGHFGLLHEAGHYIWGCHDEYKGYVGNTAASLAGHYCSSTSGTVACPMDGGTTVSPNNQRTEFCTKTSQAFAGSVHNGGSTNAAGQAVKTKQEYHIGTSCWERIQATGKGGLTAPTTAPTQTQPTHQAVVHDYDRFQGTLAMALVIDKSGSMGSENKIQLARAGAQAGVGLMKEGEHLSVVAFSSSPSVIFPATTIVSGTKAAAISAISGVNAGGGTVIGTGLTTAVSQLSSVVGCKEIIVLLTDGVSSNPDADDPAVIAALQNGNHKVYSIALGQSTNDTPLIAVATATGGKFFKANSAGELPGIFSVIFAEAAGGTPVAEETEQVLAANQTSVQTFELSTFANTGRVVLNHPDGANLQLVLTAPDGSQIDTASPPAGVTVFQSSVQLTVTIPSPMVGTWTASITEPLGSNTTYDFLVFVESSELQIGASVPSADITFPAATNINVSVIAGVPVGGANVTATVTRPDASTRSILLYDDGLAVHGDSDADDGIYSAMFSEYNGNGSYTFDVVIQNVNGQGASSLECFVFGIGEEGLTSEPIAPFQACVTQTVLLQGYTAITTPGSAQLMSHAALPQSAPVTLDSGAPTAVAGFALNVANDEPLVLGDVTFDVDTSGDTSKLERLTLHHDLDADGRIDVPSLPLAFGSAGAGQLTFSRMGGALAMLDPGQVHHFIVVAGEGLPAATGSLAQAVPFPRGSESGPAAPRLAWLALAALLALGLTATGARRSRASAPRTRGWGWAPAASLVLVLGFLGGCRQSESDSSTRSSSYALSLDPAKVGMTGSVLAGTATVSGSTQEFNLVLE